MRGQRETSVAVVLVVMIIIVLTLILAWYLIYGKTPAERAAMEAAGKIRHLYVIASVSGQVLLYSTVDGAIRRPDENSIEWTDTKGIDHQHFISGGQLVHVSDEPIVVKGVVITFENAGGVEHEGN